MKLPNFKLQKVTLIPQNDFSSFFIFKSPENNRCQSVFRMPAIFRVRERCDGEVWAAVTETGLNDWEWGMQSVVSILPTHSTEILLSIGEFVSRHLSHWIQGTDFTKLPKWEGRKSLIFPKYWRSSTASGQKVIEIVVSEIHSSLPGKHKFCSSLLQVSLNSENFSVHFVCFHCL